MGSMICCSSLEGKCEEKDIENEHTKQTDEDGFNIRCVNQVPVLSRASSHQTLAPPTR